MKILKSANSHIAKVDKGQPVVDDKKEILLSLDNFNNDFNCAFLQYFKPRAFVVDLIGDCVCHAN